MSEQAEPRADDPYGGRQPTSHELHAGQPWDASYRDRPPPWDIGGPQPAIVRLASEGAFRGPVLDAGCGTGENALHIASLGVHVVGVDVAETAVSIAREKAAARRIEAHFVVADAFRLDRLDQTFETALDCGLFHALDGDERRSYAASLAAVTSIGGNAYVLCFSDADPDAAGPHPVGEQDLESAFSCASGWTVATIAPDRIHASFAPQGAPAWLAKIGRVEPRN